MSVGEPRRKRPNTPSSMADMGKLSEGRRCVSVVAMMLPGASRMIKDFDDLDDLDEREDFVANVLESLTEQVVRSGGGQAVPGLSIDGRRLAVIGLAPSTDEGGGLPVAHVLATPEDLAEDRPVRVAGVSDWLACISDLPGLSDGLTDMDTP